MDKLNAADFLKWRSLYFGGMDVRAVAAGGERRRHRLTDFYTRLILNAQGGLNIREITAQPPTRKRRPMPGRHPARSIAVVRRRPELAVAKLAPPPSPPPVPLTIKRITLRGGNIAYGDRFIKPNYDANLTGMGGKLVNLSSNPEAIAEPTCAAGGSTPRRWRWSAASTFRRDKGAGHPGLGEGFRALQRLHLRRQYVGYGIEKGKLSANLGYKIVDRKLTATWPGLLDQLTFGDKVDSLSALKLPVLLAVSLLKNSRGEIDLDLPVGGSLDDPSSASAASWSR